MLDVTMNLHWSVISHYIQTLLYVLCVSLPLFTLKTALLPCISVMTVSHR